MTTLRSAFTPAFNATLGDLVIAEVNKASAFQSVATQAQFDGRGLIIPILGRGKASWVAEGGKKLSNDAPVSVLSVTPHVLQRTVIFSEQLTQDHKALTDYIVAEAVGSIAVGFDQTIAGEEVAPTGFDQLSTATGTTITSYSTFRAAIAAAGTKPTTAIVLNVALLDELSGVVNSADTAVLNIVGDYSAGTINGIPYRVFESDSTAPVGFVGPFNRAYWGIVPGSFTVEPLEEAAYDENGNVILLKAQNLRAVRVELRAGFRVINLAEFKKLNSNVPAPTA